MSIILFVSPPRRVVQFFAETAKHCGLDWRYFSIKPPVRSILRQLGVSCLPLSGRLDAVQNAAARVELPGYKRGERLVGRRALIQQRVAATLTHAIDEQKIEALFIWNGAGLIGATAAGIARARGLPVLFAENGYFPDTMQLDPRGVNNASSATAVARERRYLGYQAPATATAATSADEGVTIRPVKPSRWSRALPELRRLLSPAAWAWLQPVRAPQLPRELPADLPPYLFVPLQVSKDSQLLQYSPLIGNDFGLLLDRLSAALAQQHPDWLIVVKPHPAEHRRVQRQYQAWLNRWPNVIFATAPSSIALIRGSRGVVTVNSTVGFEGLVENRPVITLGENFYCFAPLVHPVPQLDQLGAVLEAALSTPVDAVARQQFLDYVRHELLIDCGYRRISPVPMQRFAAAVERKLAAIAKDAAATAQLSTDPGV